LWTKVRFSIVRTLQEMTLADLVLGPALPASAAIASGPILPSLDTAAQTLTTGA
jgi:hypothetical protein